MDYLQKLSEIKHRLRRSLNQSGICTLQELTPLDGESVVMLNDISVPEPLFEEHELNSHGQLFHTNKLLKMCDS